MFPFCSFEKGNKPQLPGAVCWLPRFSLPLIRRSGQQPSCPLVCTPCGSGMDTLIWSENQMLFLVWRHLFSIAYPVQEDFKVHLLGIIKMYQVEGSIQDQAVLCYSVLHYVLCLNSLLETRCGSQAQPILNSCRYLLIMSSVFKDFHKDFKK